ncbi:hypothetical protein VOLCADRAFT_106471 [Volvox carteri f. nagariensis]|uniref:Uncharacterized protein n=1 Tax=Volvox carteri f. nagariensis TaxID=3068 RepID=D8U7L5_VOLCA|nr:uncharacterized protein VOLCADRAFT_106471 [Volvox carteri f. nagariensis]EFJ44256.1 hypothetical protein VOLCADRAFT_106471 [Volvox carteri f. nagariensis]|eukprot:XP_002954615.1 hypothetical protein VOLCADRAFT_106471 [Volvox carteri f. nagariensis]
MFQDPEGMLTRLVRSFAAGVIAALALVHIIPEAVEEMSELGGVEYPLGGTCALGGVALMILLEHMAHIMHDGDGGGHAVGGASKTGNSIPHKHKSSKLMCPVAVDSPRNSPSRAPAAVAEGCLKPQTSNSGDELHMDGGAVGGSGVTHGHSHVCVSRGSAPNWLAAGTVEAMGSLRLKVVAYLFEIGCIFHSFIIGLSLGVNQTDLKEVRSLLIALAFHQWLEGISLASVVIRGGFTARKGALMILTYSLTCPVGIAIGMAIAETYDGESTKSRGIQGAFNGVSGGMLLYISLVQSWGVADIFGVIFASRAGFLSGCGRWFLIGFWIGSGFESIGFLVLRVSF